MEEIPFNPTRRLCPDGACVGVVGADGRCSVCRRSEAEAAAGADFEISPDEPEAAMEETTSDVSTGDPLLPFVPASQGSSQASQSSSTSRFDPKRRLCVDGSCVGVVGADGVCGTCGRKAD